MTTSKAWQRLSLAAAGTLAVLCGTLVVTLDGRGTGWDDATLARALRACRTEQDSPKCRRDTMAVIYQDSGLNETLSVVEGFLDNEWDGIGGPIFCHDLYHDLGWVAGEDLAEAALIPGASRCEGGYYHAVLLTNPEMSPRTCSNLPYEDAFNCWHGAGHAAFSSQQNPVAVPRPCPVADTPDFTQICQQGYYMEYAHSLQWPVESLRFCLDVPDDVKFNCLQPLVGSVTVSQPSKVEDVLSVCAELDDYNLQQTCWRSAGFGIQSIQLSDPGFATPNRCVSNKYCQEGLKQAANWAAE